jgi:hypothetical protein
MARTICPNAEPGRLGDIEESLAIGFGRETDSRYERAGGYYYIALSDGSLIRATVAREPNFEVIIEGAARIRIELDHRLTVSWNIEWINVSAHRSACAVAQKLPVTLPLFRHGSAHQDLAASTRSRKGNGG